MFLEERTAVAITTGEAERMARELYRFTAVATNLPGEYDSNFHLRVNDGREFVLKFMHPARETAFIDMQCAAPTHLQTHAPSAGARVREVHQPARAGAGVRPVRR